MNDNPFIKYACNSDTNTGVDLSGFQSDAFMTNSKDEKQYTLDVNDESVRNKIVMKLVSVRNMDVTLKNDVTNFITNSNHTNYMEYYDKYGPYGPEAYRYIPFNDSDYCVCMYYDDVMCGVVYLKRSDKYLYMYELVDLYLSHDFHFTNNVEYNYNKEYGPFRPVTELKRWVLDYLADSKWNYAICYHHVLHTNGSEDYSEYKLYYRTHELESLGFKLAIKGVEKCVNGLSQDCSYCVRGGYECKRCFCRVDMYVHDFNDILKNRFDSMFFREVRGVYCNYTTDDIPEVQFVRT